MKKAIKHIWKYITSPSYRMMIDLVAVSKAYEDAWKAIQENRMRASYPIIRVEIGANPKDTLIAIKSFGYMPLKEKDKKIISNVGVI